MGWNDVSFHGSLQIPTPNIDSLASQGVVLNNYYVQPLCSPSRGSLMTGLYPIHLGLQHSVIGAAEPRGLPLQFTIMPQHLKNLGYATHMVGKWHLGFFKKEYTPTFRGFDSHYGYWGGKEDYYDHTQLTNNGTWGLDFRYNMESITYQSGLYSTELFTNHASNIILGHDFSQPLFLYMAHQAVHTANSYDYLQAPPEYTQRFPHIQDEKRKLYAGMVAALDDSVKIIVNSLKERCELQNSIIIFSSDNGGPPQGQEGSVASNWPLRGGKFTVWEGGVRGAAFIWSPLLKKPYRTTKSLMHVSDWLPTFYYVAGGDPADLGLIDGYNMWDALSEGAPSPRTEVLLNIDPIDNLSALRVHNYKVLNGTTEEGKWDSWFGPSGRDNPALRDVCNAQPQFKSELLCGNVPKNATPCFPTKAPCLFDIEKDPCEYNNIADEKPEVLNRLLEKLSVYAKGAVPPNNKPKDPRSNPIYYNNQWVNWYDYIN